MWEKSQKIHTGTAGKSKSTKSKTNKLIQFFISLIFNHGFKTSSRSRNPSENQKNWDFPVMKKQENYLILRLSFPNIQQNSRRRFSRLSHSKPIFFFPILILKITIFSPKKRDKKKKSQFSTKILIPREKKNWDFNSDFAFFLPLGEGGKIPGISL